MFRYWDSGYDEELMGDRIAMNVLFLQVPQPHFISVLCLLTLLLFVIT